MLENNIKKLATKSAIKEQKRVQELAELKREERERNYDSEQSKKGNAVIARVYPLMVDYYASVGKMVTSMLRFLLISLVMILIYIIGSDIYDNGFEAALEELWEMCLSFEWNHAVFLIMFFVFFAGIDKLGKLVGRYMEHTVCVFTEQYVHICNFFRKDKFISYDEIGECIKKRKIFIKHGAFLLSNKQQVCKK